MDQEIDAGKGVEFDPQDLTDVNDFTDAELQDESIDWKAKALEWKGIAKRRTTALRKAKDAIPPAKAPKPAEDPNAGQAPKKGELDYGQKAYLNSLGFKDAEDHTFVQGVMKDTGKSLEDVLASGFVQSELKRLGEERATKAAQPPAGEGRQAPPARDTVDYWLAKGELPPADQPELRRKVVNAKIARQKSESQFSDTPVVGGSRK